jgi:hypothetical protein
MAYFAKLGTGNIVENVISINNSVITDSNGVEQEQLGIDFINQLYNTNDTWKQTSYNNNIRKNYAGIGYTYDSQRNAFIAPKPYNSWILNEETCIWEPPVSKPTEQLEENKYYSWNEVIINWEIKTRQ